MKSLQLQLLENKSCMHMTEPFNISFWTDERLMKLHSSLSYWQLMVVGRGNVIFFSDVAINK